MALAEWIADTAGSLLESRGLLAARSELETAQRQMRLQDDFVSTISHELRTPLGFIKGYTTSLLREDTIWDEKTRREFLSIIEEEADRLRTLLENMLESARAGLAFLEGMAAPEEFDTSLAVAVLDIEDMVR